MFTNSISESSRFGLNVFRIKTEELNPKELANNIIENNADLVILRIPSNNKSQLNKIEKLGFPMLIADSLVYYSVDLLKYTPKPIKNSDIEFVRYTTSLDNEMDYLVEKIFKDYKNHYSNNPFLNQEKFILGYKEWARTFVKGNDSGKITWLVKRKNNFVGFCACQEKKDENFGEGVLYGIVPEESGGGLYGDMIRFTQNYFKNLGYPIMKVSTQVENFAVQKVWAREGFFMSESITTVHINTFLKYSVENIVDLPFKVSIEQIRKFGETSGDFNPLHFDNEKAKKCGFEGRIAHGLIFQSELSRIFGTRFPGEGTVFLNTSSSFFSPIYPEKEYKLRISFPFKDPKKGIYKAVAFLKESKTDKLCLLSYSDLLKKPLLN